MSAHRRVTMRLVGEDGNSFAILGRFQRAAKAAGWIREEIKAVMDEATSGDYDHLLATISDHVEEPDDPRREAEQLQDLRQDAGQHIPESEGIVQGTGHRVERLELLVSTRQGLRIRGPFPRVRSPVHRFVARDRLHLALRTARAPPTAPHMGGRRSESALLACGLPAIVGGGPEIVPSLA